MENMPEVVPDSWFLILVLISVSVSVRVRNANQKHRIRNQPQTYTLSLHDQLAVSPINSGTFNIWSSISTWGGSKKYIQ